MISVIFLYSSGVGIKRKKTVVMEILLFWKKWQFLKYPFRTLWSRSRKEIRCFGSGSKARLRFRTLPKPQFSGLDQGGRTGVFSTNWVLDVKMELGPWYFALRSRTPQVTRIHRSRNDPSPLRGLTWGYPPWK